MRGLVFLDFQRFRSRSNLTASLNSPQSVETEREVVNEFGATQQGEANEESSNAS